MNKKDLATAKRALAARQVKNEHKFIKSIMLQRTGTSTTGGLSPGAPGARTPLTSSGDWGNTHNSTSLLPEMPTSSVNSPKQSTTLGPRSSSVSSLPGAPGGGGSGGMNDLSFANSEMVKELAHRATT
jgi:hypothetical protein